MKLTYALLRKQRTHNLRYVVRTLLMKLAPEPLLQELSSCESNFPNTPWNKIATRTTIEIALNDISSLTTGSNTE